MDANQLPFFKYIDYIVENNVSKSDMYDYVLINGKSNIEKLNYMLGDIKEIIFIRRCSFIKKRKEFINRQIERDKEKGRDLPVIRRTLEEDLESLKSMPAFNKRSEPDQKTLIEMVKNSHEDFIIDGGKLVGNDWKYHNVRVFKKCICEEINRLSEAIKTNKNYINQPQQSVRFTRSFTTDEQKRLFDGLIRGDFLPKGTPYGHFCYVFGGTPVPDNETPFKPLEWQKSTALMAYLIDNLFSDTDPKCLWGTTARLFVYKGKAPNKDSLKSAVSKCKQDFRNKPKGYEILDDVLRSL